MSGGVPHSLLPRPRTEQQGQEDGCGGQNLGLYGDRRQAGLQGGLVGNSPAGFASWVLIPCEEGSVQVLVLQVPARPLARQPRNEPTHPPHEASQLNLQCQPCSSAAQPRSLGAEGEEGAPWPGLAPGGVGRGTAGVAPPGWLSRLWGLQLAVRPCGRGIGSAVWGLGPALPRPERHQCPDSLRLACLGVTSLRSSHPHLNLPVSERP